MRPHLHRWSRWRAIHHYIDTSWGGRAQSTRMVRRCEKCGAVKTKGLYGVGLPLDIAADDSP